MLASSVAGQVNLNCLPDSDILEASLYKPFSDKSVQAVFSSAAVGGTDDYEIPDYVPVPNQLQESSCVCNAWCDALEMLRSLSTPDHSYDELSRQYLYWLCRAFLGKTKEDKGTHLYVAADRLMNVGVCPETYWPYSPNRVFIAPSLEANEIASDNKLAGFYRINPVGDEVELALRTNHPVVYGTAIGQEFLDYTGDPTMVFTPPSSSVGNHAMLYCGVRRIAGRRQFKTKNSWSNRWGINGYAWVDESYLTWSKTHDLWVGTQMPKLVV